MSWLTDLALLYVAFVLLRALWRRLFGRRPIDLGSVESKIQSRFDREDHHS
jgi:hypothetical protein